MAIPALPTVTSIVTEGLYQGGVFNPSAQQIARYSGDPMEQLKNSLWQELKQAKPLMTFSYMVLTPGQSRYSCPTDYASDMTMTVMTGFYTGPILSATANTVTLPLVPNGNFDINQVLGEDLVIASGTGMSSVSQIIGLVSNSPTTQTLTVYPDFQTTPDATSTYMIVDNTWPVEQRHIAEYDIYHRSGGQDRPRYFFPMGNEDYDEFIFDVAPDNFYFFCARMRYTVNFMTLDLNSTLLSTLYQKFREFWIYGIKSQVLMDNDDTRAPKSQEDRMAKLQALIRSQQYGTDLHNFAQHVVDYQ
jgi:hypothetical protein